MGWIKNYSIDMERLPPALLFKSGLLVLLCSILLGTILLLLPIQDSLKGEVTILSNGQALQMKAPSAGLLHLSIQQDASIRKGEVLATIDRQISGAELQFATEVMDSHLSYFDFNRQRETSLALRPLLDLDLQEVNQELITLLDLMRQLEIVGNSYNPSKIITSLKRSMANKVEQIKNYQKLGDSYKQLLSVMRTQLHNDSLLYANGGISLREYEAHKQQIYERESILIENELSGQVLAGDIIAFEKLSEEKRLQYNSKMEELKLQVLQQVSQVRKAFQLYKKQYIIQAPITGKVRLPSTLADGQMVALQEPLFTIANTSEQQPSAYMTISPANAGKVKEGQRVRVGLSEFNQREFGIYYTTVSKIDDLLDDNEYRIFLNTELPLTTSYNYKVPYRQRYTGKGEILLGKVDLWTKIWRQIRYSREKIYND